MSGTDQPSQYKFLDPPARSRLAQQVAVQTSCNVFESSMVLCGETLCFLAGQGAEKWLGVAAPAGQSSAVIEEFTGQIAEVNLEGQAFQLKRCRLEPANAVALRALLPYTAPALVGLAKSFGCGDRLGVATPGHIAAAAGKGLKLVLAQQSIREMTRTARTAQQVMDDATWGVFQAGYSDGFGSDADHLKTTADIDLCVRAGFGMFTIDPGDHVDNAADALNGSQLQEKFQALPWQQLQISPEDCLKRYEKTFKLDGLELSISAEQVMRAAVKYGRAVAHTKAMFQHLLSLKDRGTFELEVSVDETETPTTPAEHYYVAAELKRLDVQWVSLAPRFVGDFEKGIDYKGDLKAFEDDFKTHAAIARYLGPYKLSIHSGSDKFSIYPIAARQAGQYLHVKTAGTSYLEALRVIAQLQPQLFREILDFARERYESDRASYHVSANLVDVPASKDLADHQLADLLNINASRQILHVTFGSVMTARDETGGFRFKDRLLQALLEHEEAYDEVLKRHIGRHVDLLK